MNFYGGLTLKVFVPEPSNDASEEYILSVPSGSLEFSILKTVHGHYIEGNE